jgi:hypothetical protein
MSFLFGDLNRSVLGKYDLLLPFYSEAIDENSE